MFEGCLGVAQARGGHLSVRNGRATAPAARPPTACGAESAVEGAGARRRRGQPGRRCQRRDRTGSSRVSSSRAELPNAPWKASQPPRLALVITRILAHRARGLALGQRSRSPPPARRRSSALATGGPLSSPFPFLPAPESGSGAPRRAHRSPPVENPCLCGLPAGARGGEPDRVTLDGAFPHLA